MGLILYGICGLIVLVCVGIICNWFSVGTEKMPSSVVFAFLYAFGFIVYTFIYYV